MFDCILADLEKHGAAQPALHCAISAWPPWPTPASAPTNCRPIATPWPSCSTACPGTRASPCRTADRPRPARAAHRPARLPVGRQPVEPPAGRLSLRRPATTPPSPGPSSSTRPRGCRASALDWFVANASRAAALLRPAANPDQPLRAGTAAARGRGRSTSSRSAWPGPASSAPASRATTASSNGTTPMNGAYWRTYDFEAIPQNLIDRDLLLPDRRNIFAYPLGPGLTDGTPSSTPAGEVIFNLPNGLQGYMLVNANNIRQTRATPPSSATPSGRTGPSRPACRACRATPAASTPKDDQIRDHVGKNPKAFSRADAELIRALYVPKAKMKALMDEDAERFRKALEKTGNKVSAFEPVMTMTLRYEADVDLPTLAAEVGVKPEELLPRLVESGATGAQPRAAEGAGRHGAAAGGGAGVRRHGARPAARRRVPAGPDRPDACRTTPARSIRWRRSPAPPTPWPSAPTAGWPPSPAPTRRVAIWDVEAGRELRRCIGHTASVWCVAFSPDGTRRCCRAARTARCGCGRSRRPGSPRNWTAMSDLVTGVAFSPRRPRALSAGYDQRVILLGPGAGRGRREFRLRRPGEVHQRAGLIAGRRPLCGGRRTQPLRRRREDRARCCRLLTGHTDSVVGGSVLGRRQAHPVRQRRPDGAAVGRGDGQGNPGLFGTRGRRQKRGLRRRTASRSCPAGPTRRYGCGTRRPARTCATSASTPSRWST